MKSTLSFVRLDLITIKPYLTLKNFLIFGVSALFVVYGTKTSVTALGILMGFGTLYITYPFAVGEKNGIDSLYVFLGIDRKTVVIGRYVYALIINLAFCLFALVITLAVSLIMRYPFSFTDNILILIILFFFFSFSQFFQIPIYFKLGFSKARLLAYVPFLIIPLIVVFVGQLYPLFMDKLDSFLIWITDNPIIIVGLLLVFWLTSLYISVHLSQKFYQKREF